MADAMPMARLGRTGFSVSRLGLGCSHLASLSTPVGRAGIARLLDAAWDGGIRFFDTADIYGQGDSERRLARVASRPGAVICTKAGLKLTVGQTPIRLLKPILRPLLQAARGARAAAGRARAAAEAHDLTPADLAPRLDRSLGRLRRDRVDLFLLHSPPRAALENADLLDSLAACKASGKAAAVGVSCQTADDARWLLHRHRLDAVEVPIRAATLHEVSDLLTLAQDKGVAVIAREVLGGDDPAHALPPLLSDPRLAVTLVGTTNAAHLATNIKIAHGV